MTAPNEKRKLTASDVAEFIPFAGMMVDQAKRHAGPYQTMLVRLLEAGIIGGVVMYGTVEAMGQKITALEIQYQADVATLKEDIAELKADLRDIRSDFYLPNLGD